MWGVLPKGRLTFRLLRLGGFSLCRHRSGCHRGSHCFFLLGLEVEVYFDRLLDFVYVELMKGLQKGFLPKRCSNCGRWFVQKPGMDFNYCANPAPQYPTKLCRVIGSTNNFIDKKKNHEIWNVHQKAYRKYYARMLKKNMTKEAFFTWAEEAAVLRDKLLPKYNATKPEDRKVMAENYRQEINKL